MGANLCTMCHPISDKKSKSHSARDDRSRSSCKKSLMIESLRRRSCKRKMEMDTEEKKNIPKLTLEDWIVASPGLRPDYVMRGESKQLKKKVHPCSSQFHGSLLAEAKDSLCLDRPMNHDEEGEGMLSFSSVTRSGSFSGKSKKRVSFKLPDMVKFYSPDEPYCKEATPEKHEPYYSSENEESFSSSICRENSFDSEEEPILRLAVDILPHVFVSSKI